MDQPAIAPIVKNVRYDLCVAVYQIMEERSQPEFDLDTDTDPPMRRMWEGHISKLMASLGKSQPAGTQVISDLERMGCIEIKQVGHRGTMTQVILRQPPTEELFVNWRDPTHNATAKETKRRADLADKGYMAERIRLLEEGHEALLNLVQEHLENHCPHDGNENTKS